MSATDPTHGGTVTDPAQTVAKGKGKAVDTSQDVSMGEEDDDSSDEETGAEEDEPEPVDEDEDEDDLQEVDPGNIVGNRTRGKEIDYSKVDPSEIPEDDEDDEDDDFEDPETQHHDAMEE